MTSGLRATDMAVLRVLAELGAMHRKVLVTTSGLAKEVGISQQAASAALIRLQERGYVARVMTSRGQLANLSPGGVSVLRADYAFYKRLFEGGGTVEVEGTVVAGLGEGSYYLSRPSYETKLHKLLGAKPFRGTLNLKLQGADLDFLDSLRGLPGAEVGGFVEGGRTFGPIKCFRAEVEGVGALVVMPARTHYADVMELVAPVHLRGKFGLMEGDKVRVKISL